MRQYESFFLDFFCRPECAGKTNRIRCHSALWPEINQVMMPIENDITIWCQPITCRLSSHQLCGHVSREPKQRRTRRFAAKIFQAERSGVNIFYFSSFLYNLLAGRQLLTWVESFWIILAELGCILALIATLRWRIAPCWPLWYVCTNMWSLRDE